MTVVLRIAGVAGVVTQRETLARVGEYVKSFDPDAHDGRGQLVTTPAADMALRFANVDEALAFYRTQSAVRPLRPDGRPNRPLTAFTVAVDRLPEGAV